MLFACGPRAVSQTPDESVLSRQSDEGARTREERQHALTILSTAAQQARRAEPIKAAQFLNRAARLQLRLNLSKDALISYQSVLAILNHNPDSTARIDALNGMAAVYAQLSKWDEAKRFVDEALEMSRKNGSVTGQAEALLTLSNYQSVSSDQEEAIGTVTQSLQLWESMGDKRGMARAYLLLSDFRLVQHNLAEATKSSEAALNIWRELNLPDEIAGALISLGFIEYRKGAWQECLSLLSQAQRLIDEKSEPYRMAQINIGMAEAFMESGIPEAGLTRAQAARVFFLEAEKPQGAAAATWDIGKAQYLLGDSKAAITTLEEAKKESEAAKAPRLTALCHDYLGRTFVATGDQARALQNFQIALGVFERLHQPREAARVRALMGPIHENQRSFDTAREDYTYALETSEKLKDQVNQSAALYALGKLELKLNNLDLAETYLSRSIEATENLRRVSTSNDLMTAMAATVHDRYETYVDCLMRKHAQQPERDFAVRAFEASELARARALAELLRATQTNLAPGVDPQLAAQEKSLRQSLRVKEDGRLALAERQYKQEDLSAIEAELASLETQHKQVVDTIRARYPAYQQIAQPAALHLNEIQATVCAPDETLLLEFSLGEENSYLWAVSRTEFSSHRLPGRKEIEEAARRLYDLLTANQPREGETREQRNDRIRQAEEKLPTEIAGISNMLLAPVADKLGKKRLIIVADGALQYIPFQALTFPNQTNPVTSTGAGVSEPRYLAFDHEIVNQPSASTLALLMTESAKRMRPTKGVAILADPVFETNDSRVASQGAPAQRTDESSWGTSELNTAFRDIGQPLNGKPIPRLRASRDEAEAIMQVVPRLSGFKALDFEASRNTVFAPGFGQHSIVHFASHAILDNQRPEFSGIILSMVGPDGKPQNGFLRMPDIYDMNLPVDLVVLSACQTGLGKDVRGEGLISLTRGFMYAGASGVTASLWKVEDEATAELMKRFYTGMFTRGLTPAAALREAQISISREKRWKSPFFWAGFVIQGQYDQKVSSALTSTATPSWVIGLGIFGTIFLFGIFFLVLRRRRRVL